MSEPRKVESYQSLCPSRLASLPSCVFTWVCKPCLACTIIFRLCLLYLKLLLTPSSHSLGLPPSLPPPHPSSNPEHRNCGKCNLTILYKNCSLLVDARHCTFLHIPLPQNLHATHTHTHTHTSCQCCGRAHTRCL